MVGFLKSRESSGWSRSTNTTRELPKAAIFSGLASDSGKWRRVAEATPSALWQARQFAFSSTGYKVVRKSGVWAASVPQANPAKISDFNKNDSSCKTGQNGDSQPALNSFRRAQHVSSRKTQKTTQFRNVQNACCDCPCGE